MAQISNRHEVYNQYARTLISIKARQLSRRADFRRFEEEDIAQDLTVHLLCQAEQFDPARASLTTFIAQVVNSCVAMILRERRRKKRVPGDGVEIQSLETIVDDAEGLPVALWTIVSMADIERRTGATSLSDIELREQAEAFDHAIRSLPVALQKVCRELMAKPPATAAKALHISRRRLRAAIADIRLHFERVGLHESAVRADMAAPHRHT